MRGNIAAAILAHLDRHGWCQGRAMDEDGRICLGRAIFLAVPHNDDASYAVARGIARTAHDLFPGRSFSNGFVPRFNDHADTTLEDVRLVVKHWAGEETG